MTLSELIIVLELKGIDPVSLTWEHVRNGVELTDPINSRFTLYVATCAEFTTLCDQWKGKRSDRAPFHGSRTLLADIGPRGLLGHVCHDTLPCWESNTIHHEPTLLDALTELTTSSKEA